MGALQAYEWAASYPDMVERIIAVIGTPAADPFLIGWLNAWAQPVLLDPKWNGGDYYGKAPPLDGLTASLKIITLHANHSDWATKAFGLAPAQEGKDPAAALSNQFKIEATLDTVAAARAATADANHLLYLIKANQLAAADPAKIKAPVLLLYSPTDLVFPPPLIEQTVRELTAAGAKVETGQVTGPNGHLNGVFAIGQAADKISAFLNR
jgi:homoserine O-acetyltransferase